MASDRVVKVAFVGDTSRLRTALRSVEDSTGKVGRNLERSAGQASSWGARITSAMRTVMFAAGGVATAVGAGLAHAFSEAREAEKIGKITESVIRSTGGAAQVTAAEVARLAEQISAKTAIDDEAIQSSANLLLTFTNVRNEVGAGNDVFNRAVALAQDMATVLGGDAQSAAMQLGKALNDPIRGVTALTRAGVQFSEQQKEQIRRFVESGDILSAQKVILEEVGRQFGGAAEAAATPTARLRVVLGNLAERIGTALLPVVDAAARWLGEMLPRAMDRLGPAFDRLVAAVTTTAVPALMRVVAAVRDNWPQIRRVAVEVFDRVRGVLVSLTAALRASIRFVLDHKDAFLVAAAAAAGFFAAFKTVRAVQSAIAALRALQASVLAVNAAMAANPIGLVVAALAALAAAVVVAYKRFEPFRNVVDTVGRALRDGFGAAVAWITRTVLPPLRSAITSFVSFVSALWRRFGDDILGFARNTWDNIRTIINGALTVVRGIVNTVLGLLTGDWSRAWDGIRSVVSGVWTAIQGLVGQAVNTLRMVIGVGLAAVRGMFEIAWNAVTSLTSRAVGGVVEFFGALPGRILGLAGAIGNAALEIGRKIMSSIVDGIRGFTGFVTDIGKAIVNAAIDFINRQIIDRINRAVEIKIKGAGPLPDININPPDIPHIPRLAEGGIVTRPTVALIGEAGPEAVVPLRDHPATVMNITVNMPPGSDGEDVIAALRRWTRRNGPLPVPVR